MNVRGACFSIALVAWGASRSADADKPEPVQQPVSTSCEVVEIWASHGKASVDPDIAKRLATVLSSNFKFTEYKQLSSASKTFSKKKPEVTKLKKGSATITLVEIVDKSQVRLGIDFTAAKGKTTQTLTVAGGDWQMTIVKQGTTADADGHILAVGNCK